TPPPPLYKAAEGGAAGRVDRGPRLARYGSDCYGYAMVAAGNADLVVECGLQSYDVVALIPVVEGAGGRFTDWEGGSAAAGGRVVASGDPRLHDQVLAGLAGA
nr:inositol monophosphatase family protein [Bauldia sp.]